MKAWIYVLFALLLPACQRTPPAQPAKEYQMQGEVVGLDSTAHLATVKAGKIEGWMEAMTMEYPVKDPQEFGKLKVGQNIQAKITVQGTDYWITSVSAEPAK
jgi:Cu/Ag efflux protein CusF